MELETKNVLLNVCGCWGFTIFKHNVNRENPHFNQGVTRGSPTNLLLTDFISIQKGKKMKKIHPMLIWEDISES